MVLSGLVIQYNGIVPVFGGPSRKKTRSGRRGAGSQLQARWATEAGLIDSGLFQIQLELSHD